MSELSILRVFAGPQGENGNPLGVFLAGVETPPERRQAIACDLGFAETVWVDDRERGEIRIFTPTVELPFAGHPAVGTAWLLKERGSAVTALRPPAGELRVRFEGDLVWIAARPEWSPPFEYPQLGSPAEVDVLAGSPHGLGMAYAWAWEDCKAGRVRARSFVPEVGVSEDEATGSAALALSSRLGRSIQIHQGQGSEIFARPLRDGYAEVGGRVVLDEVCSYVAANR